MPIKQITFYIMSVYWSIAGSGLISSLKAQAAECARMPSPSTKA